MIEKLTREQFNYHPLVCWLDFAAIMVLIIMLICFVIGITWWSIKRKAK